MKKIYYIGAMALLAGACQSKEEVPAAPSEGTREITVNSALATKTTIDYEGDISHLVWQEGDNVMYITDDQEGLYDYGFQNAAISGNKFKANISKSAGKDNKMLVVWPNKTLALGSSDFVLWMDEEVTVSSKDKFDGRNLPMVAMMNVPETDEVDASFRPLASVLRVSIDSTGHASEKLKSIRLTTAEECIGRYMISTSQPDGALFRGSENTLTVKVSDTPELRNFKYIYMVVNKAAYTGVKMEIETEAHTYTFEDGKMDLSAADRGLFRINLTLPAAEEPKEEKFVKVTEQSDITAGGKYLILSQKSDGVYYIPTTRDGEDYLESSTVTAMEDGSIAKDDKTEEYAITFVSDDDHAGKFALKSDAIGSDPYIQAPNNVTEGRSYIGIFWFGKESELATTRNCWWTITVTAEKTTIQTPEFMQFGEATGRYGAFCFFKDGSKFGVNAPETDTDEYQDVVIFKLVQ